MSEFGPVDEEQLCADSCWRAKSEDVKAENAPWNTNAKKRNANVGTVINEGQMPPNKMGSSTAIDPL